MSLLKRKDRKRRARADGWDRKYTRLPCCSDVWAVLKWAAGCVAVKMVRKKGANGRAAELRKRPPNSSCSVQMRVTRGFIA